MSEVKPEEDLPDLKGKRWLTLWPKRWRWRISMVLALLILLAAAFAWFNREQIAGNLIDDTLKQNGLEASYEIESIGTRRQVITNLVVGDPSMPDLTADRVALDISYTYGPPEVGKIELVGARLYGSLHDGKLSFGSLDALLFAESEEPAGLPGLNVELSDGRARITSDFGVIGAKIDGEGQLDDGFEGTIAATAPGVGIEGCKSEAATLYGTLSSDDGQLGFDGPVRFRELSCEGARIGTADIGTQLILARDFGSIEGDLALSASNLSGANVALSELNGRADIAMAFDGELALRHDLTGDGLASDFGQAQLVGADGTLRSTDGFTRNEWTSRLRGDGIDVTSLLDGAGLAEAQQASADTFAGALIAKIENGLARVASDAAFASDISVRTTSESLRLVIPEGRLSSSDGETLLALSRINYNTAGQGQPERLTGNILSGGADLPRINARLQQEDGGDISLRMTMAEYRSGTDVISIPRLVARRNAAGRIGFTGMVLAEGSLPGGSLRGLELPIEGQWSPGSGLAIGTRCVDAKLAGLEAYDFALGAQSLSVCPIPGSAIVRYRDTLEIAGRLSDMSIAGELGQSPARVTAASAVLRYPGTFRFESLEATIGAADNSVRMTAGSLEGDFVDGIGGSFANATAALDIVPLDLSDLSGEWSYSDSVLRVSEGAFTLTDRLDPAAGISEARFEPLLGEGAALTLEKGTIRVRAGLVHPWSGRQVTSLAIRHDLSEGAGRADINVPGIRFDEGFQPEELTSLTKGIIAFADGTIEGRGQVEWRGDELTSSGTFSTDSFDFAAAFGPVRGVKGEIEFIDLLDLTTAPSQVATIESVNPGVEALEGRVVYAIEGGTLITVEDGSWPFMGGELMLRPVKLDYGGGQGQSYVFELIGLDAATFVTQMELANIGATGKFDGTIPIVFDAQGNGTIQGGLLISRPPGGNVSYVGELSYEDLGAMGNFAFQTLRSLDYNQMSIELNGNLAGEIITNSNIDGVRQGEGASQNFVTRELAKLPIRFKVNVRSENFYTLATIVRGLFDPTVFASAAEVERFVGENIGVLQQGREADNEPGPTPGPQPDTIIDDLQRRNEPSVQSPESEDVP
jgi:hypothetical protein